MAKDAAVTASPPKSEEMGQAAGKREKIVVPTYPDIVLTVAIQGTNPLLSHSKNEDRMIMEMAYNRQRYNKGEKPPKPKPLTPYEEFLGTLYLLPEASHPKREISLRESWQAEECKGRYGFPKQAFMGAMLSAASGFHTGYNLQHIKSITIVGEERLQLRYERIEFRADLLPMPLQSKSEKGRQEEHRSKRPVVRSEIHGWGVTLVLRFQKNLFKPQEILAILVSAGRHIGVGSGRKEKQGLDFGTFQVGDVESEE